MPFTNSLCWHSSFRFTTIDINFCNFLFWNTQCDFSMTYCKWPRNLVWLDWKISWRVRRLCLLGKQMNSNRPNWHFFIMTRNHSLNFKKAFWLKLALKGFRGKKGFSGLKWLKRGLKGFPRKPVYTSISNVMEIPVFNLMDNIQKM